MPIVLTRTKIEKLAEIIRQHTAWLVWRLYGSQHVSKTDLDALKAKGILPMDTQVQSIKYAYILGKLESILKEAEYKRLTWDQLKELAAGRHTPIDHLQVEAAEMSAALGVRNIEEDIKSGLYERLRQATNRTITEAQVRGSIRDMIRTGVEMDHSYRRVARDLVETLKDPTRDWIRLAYTEMHAARQKGIVSAIINREDIYENSAGEDSMVMIDHDADACDDCLRIYNNPKPVNSPKDVRAGNPKIFPLKELLANEGTNYQRPWRKNARPVIPPLHPHCFGRVTYVPPGWGFDEDNMFTLIDPNAAYPELYE